MKKEKKVYTREITEVISAEQLICECIDSLLSSGIDEDAHHSGPWYELDDDDLEDILNNPVKACEMIRIATPTIIMRLKEALASRRYNK